MHRCFEYDEFSNDVNQIQVWLLRYDYGLPTMGGGAIRNGIVDELTRLRIPLRQCKLNRGPCLKNILLNMMVEEPCVG